MRIFETNKVTTNESRYGQNLRRLQLEESILPRCGKAPAGSGARSLRLPQPAPRRRRLPLDRHRPQGPRMDLRPVRRRPPPPPRRAPVPGRHRRPHLGRYLRPRPSLRPQRPHRSRLDGRRRQARGRLPPRNGRTRAPVQALRRRRGKFGGVGGKTVFR